MKYIYEEPVRGSLPPEGFDNLPGIERVRALVKGFIPPPPVHHLFGGRVTTFSVGSATMVLPLTPWVMHVNGMVTLPGLAESAMTVAALTRLPAGMLPEIISLDIAHMKVTTPADGSLVARADVMSSVGSTTFVEVVLEEGEGRRVGKGLAQFHNRRTDTPDAPPPTLTERADIPRYPTPDPYRRPAPPELSAGWRECHRDPAAAMAAINAGHATGVATMIGHRLLDTRTDGATGTLRTNEWLRFLRPFASPGLLATFMLDVTVPVGMIQTGSVVWGGAFSCRFLAPVPTDGRELHCESRRLTDSDEPGHIETRLVDEDGTLVASMLASGLGVKADQVAAPPSDTQRVLVTVLFTDIVGSTEQADRLGDDKWNEVVTRHDEIVHSVLDDTGGRHIKHTGDGVLATFDSPTRAVECARHLTDAVSELGIQIRAGLHTGEVEMTGHDVRGGAVNTASRVESTAGPGEVWVSETTRVLAAGSEVSFIDEGEHELKGLDEPMRLFRVKA